MNRFPETLRLTQGRSLLCEPWNQATGPRNASAATLPSGVASSVRHRTHGPRQPSCVAGRSVAAGCLVRVDARSLSVMHYPVRPASRRTDIADPYRSVASSTIQTTSTEARRACHVRVASSLQSLDGRAPNSRGLPEFVAERPWINQGSARRAGAASRRPVFFGCAFDRAPRSGRVPVPVTPAFFFRLHAVQLCRSRARFHLRNASVCRKSAAELQYGSVFPA